MRGASRFASLTCCGSVQFLFLLFFLLFEPSRFRKDLEAILHLDCRFQSFPFNGRTPKESFLATMFVCRIKPIYSDNEFGRLILLLWMLKKTPFRSSSNLMQKEEVLFLFFPFITLFCLMNRRTCEFLPLHSRLIALDAFSFFSFFSFFFFFFLEISSILSYAFD